MKEKPEADSVDPADESAAPVSAGFMKFYGLYWSKEFILEERDTEILAGLPQGWIGKGKIAKNFDRSAMWVNFWDQRGVYVLYDRDLTPVYTGQAGLVRAKGKVSDSGRVLGQRLRDHKHGKYRNGWEFFSWFGFLSTPIESEIKDVIRKDDEEAVGLKRNPRWEFRQPSGDTELNLLLDSFEAILIEAFTPRFNSRGGNLNGATYVNQLEEKPFFLKSV